MFSVVITEKGGAQRRLDFDKNEVTIGRVQGNDIILPKGNVSKRHSRIVLKDNRFIVVDLKSTNGTYVNGRKITSPLVVKSGDKIYIGDFILTLEEAAGAGAGVSAPAVAHEPPSMAGASVSQSMGGVPAAPQPIASQPQPMAPQPIASQPQPMAPQPMAPQPMAPQMAAPPPLAPPVVVPSPMSGPAAMPQAPQAPQMSPPMAAQVVVPAVPVGVDRRPPPLRSAPPPPRQPTMTAGGMGVGGAPPPLPGRAEPAPRVPSEPPPPPRDGGPADRYPLEEEPADETMAPSPRVVANARSARADYTAKEPAPRPAPEPAANAPTDMPPARAVAGEVRPVTVQHPAPASAPTSIPTLRRPAVPRAKDPADPLGHVVATLAETFDIGSLVPPEAVPADRWREARSAVDAAIARLEREGGSAGDREVLATTALQEALGLGPLGPLLDDSGVLEIVVEGPATILVDRGVGLTPAPGRFSSADQLVTIIGRLVTRGGGSFDAAASLQDATLPGGAHLVAVLPPVALRGPVIEIRRTGRAPVTGESLVQQGMLSTEMLAALRGAVRSERNVVVIGPSELGIASVVSMVANLGDPDDRVLAVEATPELALATPRAIRLAASSTVSLAQLLGQAARFRADRAVIDGVSGAEARDALLFLASRGAGCVLGVRSAPTGAPLDHIEALAGLGGAGDTLGRLLASAVQVIVRVGRDAGGVRRIVSIAEVTNDEGIPSAQELWSHTGEFHATGTKPSWDA